MEDKTPTENNTVVLDDKVQAENNAVATTEDKTPTDNSTIVVEDKKPDDNKTVVVEDTSPIDGDTVAMELRKPTEIKTVVVDDKVLTENNTVAKENKALNNTNGETVDAKEATPNQPSSKEDSQAGWRTFLALFCCAAKPQPAEDQETSLSTKPAPISKKAKKKSAKGSDSSSKLNEETASVDDLFGKQWFGYSRKKTKKGKATTNLDEIGEVKAVDNDIQKAKLGFKPRDRRPPTAMHMKRMISNDVFDNLTPILSADVPPVLESDFTDAAHSEVENNDTSLNVTSKKSINELHMTKPSESSEREEETTTANKEETNEDGRKNPPDGEAEEKKIESETIAIDSSSKETPVAMTPKAKDILSSEVKVSTSSEVKDSTSSAVKNTTTLQFTTSSKVNDIEIAKVNDIASTDAKTTKSPEALATTATPDVKVTASPEAIVTVTSTEVKVPTTSTEAKPSPDNSTNIATTSAEIQTSPAVVNKVTQRQSKLSNDSSVVKENVESPAPDATAGLISVQEPHKDHLKLTSEGESMEEKSDDKSTKQPIATEDKAAAERRIDIPDDAIMLQEEVQSTEKKADKQEGVKIAKPDISKKPSVSSYKSISLSREMSTDSVDMPGETKNSQIQTETPLIETKILEGTDEKTKDDSREVQPAQNSQPGEDEHTPSQNKDNELPRLS